MAFSRVKDEETLEVLAKKLQQDTSENKTRMIKKILSIRKSLKMTKSCMLKIRMMEVLENGMQLNIQGLMLLLVNTSTETTKGLERAFDSSDKNTSGSEGLLYFSIIVSFRSESLKV